MTTGRRIKQVTRGSEFTFTLESEFGIEEIDAYEGETIATALLASGQRFLRYTWVEGRPRGLFCAAGSCYDCLVEVDGRPNIRACSTEARPGIKVRLFKSPQREGKDIGEEDAPA
jgi:predicted molibdopterin-dependent oxidoreductase YjgC